MGESLMEGKKIREKGEIVSRLKVMKGSSVSELDCIVSWRGLDQTHAHHANQSGETNEKKLKQR